MNGEQQMNDKYAAMMVIARQVERSLLHAGATPEQAEEALDLITRIAGSHLPPVTGTIRVKLEDDRVN